MKFASVILVLAIFLGVATLGHAEKAFSILEKLEKNYVGLAKKGLNSVIGKASISVFPDADITVYWAREKGVKVKVKDGGPAAIAIPPMIEGFLSWAGLGLKKMSKESDITPEKAVGKAESATLKGSRVTKLTFAAKEGADLTWSKLVMMVDTKNWLLRQYRISSGEEEVAVTDISYEGTLPSSIVTTVGEVKSEIKNTYAKKGMVKLLSKQEIKVDDPRTPEEMSDITITYSDIKINAQIPEEVWEEPKEGKVPKPKESAEELMGQAQAAMQQGDMETAKLKLRQIVTYYPDDPMAAGAKMMLEQLP